MCSRYIFLINRMYETSLRIMHYTNYVYVVILKDAKALLTIGHHQNIPISPLIHNKNQQLEVAVFSLYLCKGSHHWVINELAMHRPQVLEVLYSFDFKLKCGIFITQHYGPWMLLKG